MRTIEKAVSNIKRVSDGMKSLNSWIDSRRVYFKTMIDGCEKEIRERGSRDTSEFIAELAECKDGLADLNRRVQNSSLTGAFKKFRASKKSRPSPGDIESRISGTSNVDTPITINLIDDRPKAGKSDKATIAGYAAVFNRLSLDLGYFKEKILPSAFSDCLKKSPDCRLLFNHNADTVMARTTNGTLRLYQDSHGLKFYGDLIPGDSLSEAVARRIQRQDVTGCSFSFTVASDKWELAKNRGDIDIRIITKIGRLLDVCPCVFPAYPSTSCSVETKSEPSRGNEPISTARAEPEAEPTLAKTRRLSFDTRHRIKTDYEYAGRAMERNNEYGAPMTAAEVQDELARIRRRQERERIGAKI